MRSLTGRIALACCCCALLGACAPSRRVADVGAIYSRTASTIGDERNPVVVIPGILGTRLKDPDSGRTVWGAFVHGAVDPDFADGARLVALPMGEGVPLRDLRDNVQPDGVLDTLRIDIGLLPVSLNAYLEIMKTLGVGQYRDRDLGEAGAVDYGGAHFTCDQFGYDWRRDVSENARDLDALVRALLEHNRESLGDRAPKKVDIVAHSMGGLVARYYLMYGTQPLPADGSLPRLTWEGAQRVERVIIVGTPNAGSALALRQLVDGVQYAGFLPTYQPAVLGTMPAVYQLMTRDRHGAVVDAATGERVGSIYDAATWERYGWGLMDPAQDRYLKWLLPDVQDAGARRRIAREQLAKCLARAEQFHRAIDVPAATPAGLELHLIAADSEPTPATLRVDARTGRVKIGSYAPGDGTVTRASALMDERVGGEWTARLRTPIEWRSVSFMFTDHLGLTKEAEFADNVLFTLLEDPRTSR